MGGILFNVPVINSPCGLETFGLDIIEEVYNPQTRLDYVAILTGGFVYGQLEWLNLDNIQTSITWNGCSCGFNC